jgi:hypothetical protein
MACAVTHRWLSVWATQVMAWPEKLFTHTHTQHTHTQTHTKHTHTHKTHTHTHNTHTHRQTEWNCLMTISHTQFLITDSLRFVRCQLVSFTTKYRPTSLKDALWHNCSHKQFLITDSLRFVRCHLVSVTTKYRPTSLKDALWHNCSHKQVFSSHYAVICKITEHVAFKHILTPIHWTPIQFCPHMSTALVVSCFYSYNEGFDLMNVYLESVTWVYSQSTTNLNCLHNEISGHPSAFLYRLLSPHSTTPYKFPARLHICTAVVTPFLMQCTFTSYYKSYRNK